jgi:hypothetical protein
VGRARRRSRVIQGGLSGLPESFRKFKPSTDTEDFREHLRVVKAIVGDDRAIPVMTEAGLDAASWYRQALDLSAKGPALRVVK